VLWESYMRGCNHAPVYDHEGNVLDGTCAFCRTPNPKTDEDVFIRAKKRMEAGDVNAINNIGCYYANGMYGFPQDDVKAVELYHRAAKLGSAKSYFNMGNAYEYGKGLEIDKKKAIHYFELAAIAGYVQARHNLGVIEYEVGNMDRSMKHFIIAAGSGSSDSLKAIQKLEEFKRLYRKGYGTKDDYSKALESYQAYLDEVKSDQRDKAAAAKEKYKYIE